MFCIPIPVARLAIPLISDVLEFALLAIFSITSGLRVDKKSLKSLVINNTPFQQYFTMLEELKK